MSRELALAWAEAGFPVHPVKVYKDDDGRWAKRPTTPNGFKDATTNVTEIETWWRAMPESWVGVAVERAGVVVVDVDPRNGGSRPADLPKTYRIGTVSGGEHLYYRGQTDQKRSPWPGVDLKRNGFVVAYGPPPERSELAWWRDGYLSPRTSSLPLTGNEASQVTAWTEVGRAGSGRYTVEVVLDGLPEGERNEGLWWYASYLRGQVPGLELDEAEERMAQAAAACRPPYDEEPARTMARRAFEMYPAAACPTCAGDLFCVAHGDLDMIEWRRIRRPVEPVSLSWGALKERWFPAPQWVVPGVIPEGLTVLAGPRKVGKSWLVGQLVCAVAAGQEFLGVSLDAGDALYLALEDPLARLARRLPDPPDEAAGRRLVLARLAPRIDDGLPEVLDTWRRGVGDPRVVVIDTLGLVRPERRGEAADGGYGEAYEDIRVLKGWADETGVAVVVIHHTRKGKSGDGHPLDRVLGSAGLTSAADTILVLDRGLESEAGTLDGTGRDIEDLRLSLKFDEETCRWTLGALLSYREIMDTYQVPKALARRWRTAAAKSDDPAATLATLAQGAAHGPERAQMRAQPASGDE